MKCALASVLMRLQSLWPQVLLPNSISKLSLHFLFLWQLVLITLPGFTRAEELQTTTTATNSVTSETSPTVPLALEFTSYAKGFEKPLQIVFLGGKAESLFVVEQTGKIVAWEKSATDTKERVYAFLDISEGVSQGEEAGLLGMAFHPNYAENQKIYVHYVSSGTNKENRISEFVASGQSVDPMDERRLIKIPVSNLANFGGHLLFGPDGKLYISLGDGGGVNDPKNYAQNPDSMLGKILRVDVDEGSPYLSPLDNPLVVSRGGLGEVWVLGLRNPRTFSFDKETKELYAGDAGKGTFQEIELIKSGANYGWSVYDGSSCLRMRFECMNAKFRAALVAYGKEQGTAVTAGYVYRGSSIPELKGAFLYADRQSGNLWALRYSGGKVESNQLLLKTGMDISSFGQDSSGEIYVANYKTGEILKLVAKGS